MRVGGATTTLALRLTQEPKLRWRVLLLLLLLVAVFGVYWSSLDNYFVWDDWDHLCELDPWGNLRPNSYIRSVRAALRSVTSLAGDSDTPSRQVFRPLRTVSFALDYIMRAGLDARRMHLTNLLLHAITVLTVYLALRALTKGFFVSIVAAGFFALHPVHTEAVDHISNRADLLAAPFLFLALASYAKRRERPSRLGWVPAVLLYAVAVLCKETAVVFPLALLLYDWAMPPKGRSSKGHLRTRLLPYATFAVVAVAYMSARRAAMGPGAEREFWGGSAGASALMMVQALARYARLAFFPLRLSARHEIPPVESLLAPEFVGGALVVVAVTLASLWALRRSPIVLFAIGWAVIFLLPVSNIVVPVPGAMLAEHWLYLPAFGVAALFGWALGGIMRKVYRTGSAVLFILAALLLIAVVAFFGTRTSLRHEVWRDNGTLFSSILEENPDNTKVRLSLGRYYLVHLRDFIRAEREYRHVVSKEPRNAEARTRLGDVALRVGDFEEAKAQLSKAIEIEPGHAYAHFALAQTLERLAAKGGEEAAAIRDEAAGHYRRFLEIAESGKTEIPLGLRRDARKSLQKLQFDMTSPPAEAAPAPDPERPGEGQGGEPE